MRTLLVKLLRGVATPNLNAWTIPLAFFGLNPNKKPDFIAIIKFLIAPTIGLIRGNFPRSLTPFLKLIINSVVNPISIPVIAPRKPLAVLAAVSPPPVNASLRPPPAFASLSSLLLSSLSPSSSLC